MSQQLKTSDRALERGLAIRSGVFYRIVVSGLFAVRLQLFDVSLSQVLADEPVVLEIGTQRRAQQTDAQGRVAFPHVPPGEHRLAFPDRPGSLAIWVPAEPSEEQEPLAVGVPTAARSPSKHKPSTPT